MRAWIGCRGRVLVGFVLASPVLPGSWPVLAQSGQAAATLDTIEVAGGAPSREGSAGGAGAQPAAQTSAGRAADPNGPESAYGPVRGYIATRSATGTKTDTPLKDTPQSISVVTAEQVRDQGATTVQEALRYTPGVFADAFGNDTRGDYPRIRGSDPDIYLDGLRLTDAFQFNEPRPDPYTLSRFEVLRGPASMLYGATSTAGLINLVSKRPYDVEYREIGTQFGNFGWKELRTDMTGRLTEDGQFLYRFVGLGRMSDFQTDFVPNDRYVINPSITWRPDVDTSWTVIALQQKDFTGSGSAFLPREGTLFPGPNGFIPFNRFTSDPRIDRIDTQTTSVTSLFEKRLNETFTVRQNLRYSHVEGVYNGLYPSIFGGGDPFLDPARRTVARDITARSTIKDRITTDQSLESRFDTGAVSHLLLTGLDFRQYYEKAKSGFGFDDRPFDLYAPVYLPVTLPSLEAEPFVAQSQLGLYLQDQMRWGPWILLGSVRHDFVKSDIQDSPLQRDEATTGRIALMYQFANGFSPYVSYATSFNPIFGNGICGFGTACRPQKGEQIEGGFKYNPTPWLVINGSIFDTVERNRLSADPDNPLLSIQSGKVGIQGGEIEVLANIAERTDIIAGYAYTDARYLAGDNAGARVETVPLHLASLWVKHRFTLPDVPGGFQVGGGVRYIGESFDGSLNSLNTPAVTLADAMVAWEDDHWRAQLSVTNIADTKYLTSCLARGDCFLGVRRTLLGTLTYKF